MRKKTKSPVSSIFTAFLTGIILIYIIPLSWREYWFQLIRSGLFPRYLRSSLAHSPADFLFSIVFCILLLVFLISVIVSIIRIIGAVTRARSGSDRHAKARKVRKVSGKVSVADEALHCSHKRGREKYLEQINGFLRSGLIEKKEYDVLYQRYLKLDIPDDYH